MANTKVDWPVAETLYRDGAPLSEISIRFGTTSNYIRNGLHARDVPSRRSLKDPKIPCPMDCSYIAGFVDGEGHIGVQLAIRPKIRQYLLQVGVENTHHPILKFVAGSFGVGAVNGPYTSARGNLPIFSFHAYARDALHILNILQPHLRVKAEVCALAIEFQQAVSQNPARVYPDKDWQESMRQKIVAINRLT